MGKDTDLYLDGTLTLFYFHIGVGQIDSFDSAWNMHKTAYILHMCI